LKILVIGAGSIGQRHAINATAIGEVAIVDQVPATADRIGKHRSIKSFGADIQAALAWHPDGVIVATPHNSHISMTKMAIEIGSTVLIEKPLSNDLNEARSFLSFLSEKRGRAFVVCNMRYHPGVKTIADQLDVIGKILFARAHFGSFLPEMRPSIDYRKLYVSNASEGGVILDGVHEIDYLLWLFGPAIEMKSMSARSGTLEVACEDYSSILIRHRDGVKSEIHLDYLRRFKRRGCEIVGEHGILDWTSEGKNPEICTVRKFNAKTGWTVEYSNSITDSNSPYLDMMMDFGAALEGREQILQSVEHASEVLALAHQAKKEASNWL
jgi:predicted dehydrogenase